jgi:integrase
MSAELTGSQRQDAELALDAEPVEGPDRGLRPRARYRPSQPNEFRTPVLPTPRPERPSSWPQTARSREEILTALDLLEPGVADKERNRRRLGMNLLLDWLERFEGASWQQRWLASGADVAAAGTWTDNIDVVGLQESTHGRAQLTGAAGRLIVLGAIRPSYQWLYKLISPAVFERFRSAHDADGFAALDLLCKVTERFTATDRQFAYCQLTRILMHNGGRLADITVEDCVEAYRAQTGYSARQHSYWYVLLLRAGILPEDSPPTVWAASRRGQLTVEELVDGYQVTNRPVRDLLVDYLHERQAAMDYVSLRQLSTKLVLLFWRDLELHEPGIDSLHLSDQMIRRWKQRLTEVRYGSNRLGKRREDPHAIYMAVRAFYADLSHWALEDPARWAHWVAPNPIRSQDTRGMTKQRSRSQAKMHQRTRELAPLLPALVEAAEAGRRHATQLLQAASAVAPGAQFESNGERLRRSVLATDPNKGGTGRPGVVYADNPDGGPRLNLTLAEDNAFWTWAIVEVLRHTGVRIEELLELTHRGFVAYTLPSTGEVVPLLQIVPSKTDRERLLVVSPELAEVLTAVIARGRGDNEQLPMVSRYDGTERLHSPPLPFLFQRPWGLSSHCFTHHYVRVLLDRLVTAANLTATDGTPLRFTPHDFRRIFATEAVGSGLPIHIAAKLLGHQTLATTQIYVAVYDNDVVEHYRAFLTRRRTLRPSEEYREPTDAEWDDFLGHFERRKVELGVCGRAYGTPCQHEHACVRCPMLRPDPAQQDRLEEIIANLHARLKEAHAQGWQGEIEGLEISIGAADQKLASMRRSRTSTDLGMPALPQHQPGEHQ